VQWIMLLVQWLFSQVCVLSIVFTRTYNLYENLEINNSYPEIMTAPTLLIRRSQLNVLDQAQFFQTSLQNSR
jgi:hypothetical protein